MTLKGHKNWVTDCVYSPDGTKILSSSNDMTLKIWDAKTGEELKTLEGHSNSVWCCNFSPDGIKVVSGSADKKVIIWDTETGEKIKTLIGHSKGVNSCKFSPDSKKIVSSSEDASIKIWDAISGNIIKTFVEEKIVLSCDFSPDGNKIVSGGCDKKAKIWDVNKGQEIVKLVGHSRRIHSCSFSPDGRKIITGSKDQTLRIWDARSGKKIKTLSGHKGPVHTCCWSPDGKYIVSGSLDMTLKIYCSQEYSELSTFYGHSGWVLACSFSPDGRMIISSDDDNKLKLWQIEKKYSEKTSLESDLTNDKNFPVLFDGNIVELNTCTKTGSRVLSYTSDNKLVLLDGDSGDEITTLLGHSNVNSCSFSPDEKMIVSTDNVGIIKIWDAQTGEELKTLSENSNAVNFCSFSPDSKKILSAEDNFLKIWDIQTGLKIKKQGHSDKISYGIWSLDGRFIFFSAGMTIYLWDLISDKIIYFSNIEYYSNNQISLLDDYFELSPDFKRILLKSQEGLEIKDWTNSDITRIFVNADNLKKFSWSLDGRSILTASSDLFFKIWDIKNENIINLLPTNMVYSINLDCLWIPDCKHILLISNNRMIIWNIETNSKIGTYDTNTIITEVSIGKGGKYIIIGDNTGSIYMLHLKNTILDLPIVTPIRLWLFDDLDLGGDWCDKITTRCQFCNYLINVPDLIIRTITELNIIHKSCHSPILDFPRETWEDPRLISECPSCHKKLKFNPFIVDNK